MTTEAKRTAKVVTALVVVAAVWEIVTLLTPAGDDTISRIVWGVREHPAIAFAAGAICSHWWGWRAPVR